MNILNKVFGSSNSRKIKKMNRVVKRINEFEELLESLSDEELKYKTDQLKVVFKKVKPLINFYQRLLLW